MLLNTLIYYEDKPFYCNSLHRILNEKHSNHLELATLSGKKKLLWRDVFYTILVLAIFF